jgi:hypothetical protein
VALSVQMDEKVAYLPLKIKSYNWSENKSGLDPDRLEARPLVPENQIENTKEKFMKEIKYSCPLNTQMLGK